ncbi:AAA-domain-containing protein, partial [Aureobasidium melanogenum]
MDNLEAIAGTQQRDFTASNLAPALVAELDRLRNTHVLVVAAAHNPNDIDKSLRTPGRLRYEIEIPIPDMRARIQILKVMQGETGTAELAETIGERTHGFVGQDLEALFNNALEHALDRYQETTTNWLPIQRTGDDDDSQRTLVNGMQNCSIIDRPRTSDTDDTDDGDLQVTLADYEKALLEVRPTAMREIFLETPKVLWSDIGGSGDVKKTLNEVVEWPLKFEQHMQALSLTPQKGILFYGPPGCSKTLTAKAVATESGLNFIAVKGAELTSMYVGESERSVREVFRKARAAAPSIIFFDEIDSIGSERDSSGTKGLNVLTTLLNEMDGIESLKGVLVLAATNKPEVLDPALLRPGRFDSLIYISPPSQSARKEILRIRT